MLIRPGETMPWCAFPDNGTGFTLAELQEAVGGSIETVALAGLPTNIALLIVNKDGHRLGLAVNDAGSFLAGQCVVGAALCVSPRAAPHERAHHPALPAAYRRPGGHRAESWGRTP
jgi:hypothetical protein